MRKRHRGPRLTWRLKSCPRCHGDLLRDRLRESGQGYFCLSCGYEVIDVEFEKRIQARLLIHGLEGRLRIRRP